MKNNTWVWVVVIVLVLVVIAGIWWWIDQSNTSAPTQATTETTTTTGATDQVTVVNQTSSSIAEVLASLPGVSTYTSLFNSTGVGATLGARGPYTVFVSTDAGYALLKPGTISNMTAAEQKRLIQYSIVSGKALDIDATNNGSVKALSGDELNFKVQPNGLVEVNSSFALEEYKASNGIIYVLNQPLLPPTPGNILTP